MVAKKMTFYSPGLGTWEKKSKADIFKLNYMDSFLKKEHNFQRSGNRAY